MALLHRSLMRYSIQRPPEAASKTVAVANIGGAMHVANEIANVHLPAWMHGRDAVEEILYPLVDVDGRRAQSR